MLKRGDVRRAKLFYLRDRCECFMSSSLTMLLLTVTREAYSIMRCACSITSCSALTASVTHMCLQATQGVQGGMTASHSGPSATQFPCRPSCYLEVVSDCG